MSLPAPPLHDHEWQDPALPLSERVEKLLAAMTLEEKLGQLGSVWLRDADGANVAPGQDEFTVGATYENIARDGLGHLTRTFGTRPVEPAEGVALLREHQRFLRTRTRLGVPAIAHEECLAGLTAFRATIHPVPLAWAAAFDAELVREMAAAVGADMAALGVHQGLAPVLDVVRDYRWGRVEETLGEDPHLVAELATAYVAGLESAGVVATLKHFAGYSASRGARNHGPVSMGRRELLDVVLPPFERALRDGGARSVMHSYSDVDGVPSAADEWLLTELLRGEWGFEGVVVSDYWGVPFLQRSHGVAATEGEAAALALRAGVDVELPQTESYGEPLAELVRSGAVDEALVDRAVRRVLRQKGELGLLDAHAEEEPPAVVPDLDAPDRRAIARRIAERSVVLLRNESGTLPLAQDVRRIALVGPAAHDASTFFGCYSFPNHVLKERPELGLGVEAPTLLDALRAELPGAEVEHVAGCTVRGDDRSGFAAAQEAAARADLVVLAVGDEAGLFGAGTSGEGCDVEDLRLPGVQADLVAAVQEAAQRAGTPSVLVVVSGRPYALGAAADAAGAVLQAFMPGEEGGPALAGVLSGRVAPSGRLPVQVPAQDAPHPGTYLQPKLGTDAAGVSSLRSEPAFCFGHGLTYTEFSYGDLQLGAEEVPVDGAVTVSLTVTNTGGRAGTAVPQLYLSDPVATVVRPVRWLTGFTRVDLEPGQSRRVTFTVHADRTALVDARYRRVVEPGRIDVHAGASAGDTPLTASFTLVGSARVVGHERVMDTPVEVS
ncbi:beta-xylosidase/alpha-l-arabinosidase [Kineococcus terrestris]|uniref:beta-xylosidase/alpha-l-arabinosidase n=1 Tax=Kineococcus terrestris TaxID=2044856 RepID=UPI0034DAE346